MAVQYRVLGRPELGLGFYWILFSFLTSRNPTEGTDSTALLQVDFATDISSELPFKERKRGERCINGVRLVPAV
jgi:hypothetical protein